MEPTQLPIAVLDSGVGGISVLRELIRVLPHEDFLYFGDSANAPYGSRTPAEVLSLTRQNLSLLCERGIKAFVIACNTATSAAAATLRAEHPELPIIGIEPAIKPAAFLFPNPRVLVMATPLTLKEEKFRALAAKYEDREEIIPLPCPGLVELIEAGLLDDSDAINRYLQELFAPYKNDKIDAVVLGCTHYPHIRGAIARHVPLRAMIIDGGEGTARETHRRLSEAQLLSPSTRPGTITMINTANDPRLDALSELLLYR